MLTVEQAAKLSLGMINEKDAIAPLDPQEVSDFILTMNNYMLSLDADNITLGYTIVDSPEDLITIPNGALRGLVANMAIELSPGFDAAANPRLDQIARDGYKQMQRLGQSIGDTFFPDTLPIGSGNEGQASNWNWSHFFPGEEDPILAETTGQLSLEINTNEVIDDS